MRKRLSVALMATITTCAVCWGGNHYVRAGASGTGSTWANAYGSLPSVLVRGDTYYVADGSYASYTFDDANDGTKVITVKKATATDHGTQSGWNAAYGDGVAEFAQTIVFATSYYVFDGRTRNSTSSGHGFKIRNTPGGKMVLFYNGGGANPQPHDITIRYVEMQHRGRNTDQEDDAIYGLDYGAGGGAVDNLKIQYCYIHDLGRECVTLRNANNVLMEYNHFARNASSAVSHSQGFSGNGCNNVTIRYNIWEDIEGTGIIVLMDDSVGVNWQIYGNVFFHSASYGVPPNDEGLSGVVVVINNSSALDWRIFNNTFVNLKGIYSGLRFNDNQPIGTSVACNNLWFGCVNSAAVGIPSSYNWYYSTARNPNVPEANEVAGAGNPFVDLAFNDFELAVPTPAGFTLPSPYDVDMNGTTRGIDGVWDRGAFENGGGLLSPPTGLRLVD